MGDMADSELTEGKHCLDGDVVSLFWWVWINRDGLDGCSGLVVRCAYNIITKVSYSVTSGACIF